jgi:hypothetical protein
VFSHIALPGGTSVSGMKAGPEEVQMKAMIGRRPSPALVVAAFALVAALAGTAVAGPVSNKALSKSKVKKIADKEIAKKAPDLSVAHASTADNADNANNANAVGGASLDSLTLGRSATGSCDPSSTAYVSCGNVSLTLPRAERVLVIADASFDGNNSGSTYAGNCRVQADGTTVGASTSPGSSDGLGVGFNGNGEGGTGINAVTDVLAAGAHNLTLQCNQAGGSIEYSGNSVSALAVGAG